MFDLLERMEAMGSRGGIPMIVLAVVAAGVGLLATLGALDLLGDFGPLAHARGPEHARWLGGALVFAAFMAFVVALPSGILGARLLTQRHYPPAEEVFPSMSVEQVREALAQRTEDLCVCTRCRVVVPAAFSTGACPVCASSLEYNEVGSDEDARMVIAAMT